MKNTRLNDAEIDQLLATYRSQRVELSEKLSKIQKKIKKLKSEQTRRSS